MANLIIKPSTGGQLILKDEGDTAAITVSTTGNTTLAGTANALGTVTAGTIASSVTLSGMVVKKLHYFEFSTRTAGTTTAGDQFTFTSSFVPLDPANNSFWCVAFMPTHGNPNYWAGWGLRFNDGTNTDDYFGRGVHYNYLPTSDHNKMSGQSLSFNVGAGDLVSGTFTITLRTETNDSMPSFFNPNAASDDARLASNTRSTLMITEYKN